MECYPDLAEFTKAARSHNVVAVTAKIATDMDTPISLYYKLVGDGRGFILESVDTTKNFGRFSFIGLEPMAEIAIYPQKSIVTEGGAATEYRDRPLAALQSYLNKFKAASLAAELPLLNGGIVGYFNYETVASFERVRGLNLTDDKILGQFMLCRILIVMDKLYNTSHLVYLAAVDGNTDCGAAYKQALDALVDVQKRLTTAQLPKPRSYERHAVDLVGAMAANQQAFAAKIDRAKEYINKGDIFQVVLSEQFSCSITKPPFYLYRRLRQVNPSPYMFYLDFGAKKLVGSSPEMLVKVDTGGVHAYPIAGTRPRGQNAAADDALAEDMRGDAKERAEHAMLVDLARNDVGKVSLPGTLRVNKLMEVEKFSHVMHMVSEVQGELRPDSRPLDALRACFPAGTVSGAPKIRAMEIINELERLPRHAYAGTVGYVDFFGNMDMCITIRTIQIEGGRAVVQAGAGIVADSVADKEYQEILNKAKALFQVIEEVEGDDFID